MKRIAISLMTLLLLTACAGGSSASIQGGWKLVSYGSASDLKPAAPEVETSIEFGSDGKMNGNVGCNGFGGDYKVKGDTIEFGSVMSTMMFCEAVAEQETATLAVLQKSATFALDGNILTITSENGNLVIVLERN